LSRWPSLRDARKQGGQQEDNGDHGEQDVSTAKDVTKNKRCDNK
jgi:hypothetical protein